MKPAQNFRVGSNCRTPRCSRCCEATDYRGGARSRPVPRDKGCWRPEDDNRGHTGATGVAAVMWGLVRISRELLLDLGWKVGAVVARTTGACVVARET